MKRALRYIITIAVGLAIALGIVLNGDVFHETNPLLIYRTLSDAFCVPGILITGFGLLIFCSNEGAFDGVTYAVKSFFNMFRRNRGKTYASLYDYREAKGDKKLGFGYMVICGLVFLAVGIILNCIYRKYIP